MPGQIMLIEEKYYPMDEAIQKAAEQNVRRDFNLHLIGEEKFEDLDEAKQAHYRAAAYDVLCKIGKNYVPNYPDFERICVAPEKVYYPMEQAVIEHANQSVEEAHKLGILNGHTVDDLPPAVRQLYLDNSRRYLEENGGVGIAPAYPNKHIHVQK